MIPVLRFPEFSGEWKRAPLSDVLRVKRQRNFDIGLGKADVLSVSGDVGIVNQIDHLGRSYAGALVDNYHVVDVGDIVYTKSPLKSNPFGIIKLNKHKRGIVSTLYAVYEIKPGHDQDFWNNYFELDDRTNHYLMPLVHKGAKNDMKISNERVLIDPVIFPECVEQQKIADFLNSVDRRIDLLNLKTAELIAFKKSMMQRIFTKEFRFSNGDGSPFPDWQERKLSSVGSVIGGLSGKSAEDFGEGEPYVTYSQVFSSSRIELNECGKVRIGPLERQNQLQYGDILFTASSETPGEVGFSSVIAFHPERLFLNSFCFALRPHSVDQLIPEFSQYLFRSARYRELVYPLAQGSTRYNMSKTSFIKLALELPHPVEQLKIATFLTAIDKKIDGVANQTQAMRKFKKALLQRMFV